MAVCLQHVSGKPYRLEGGVTGNTLSESSARTWKAWQYRAVKCKVTSCRPAATVAVTAGLVLQSCSPVLQSLQWLLWQHVRVSAKVMEYYGGTGSVCRWLRQLSVLQRMVPDRLL
jgi:hypothetical protein